MRAERSSEHNVPDPERARWISSIFTPSRLDEVAQAVSVASEEVPEVYIERIGSDRYRWSLIHAGGPYPLLRISARFLKMNHHALLIGYRGVQEGYSALSKDPDNEPVPQASAILNLFVGPVSADEASDLIHGALE